MPESNRFEFDVVQLKARIPLARGDVVVTVIEDNEGAIAITENGIVYRLARLLRRREAVAAVHPFAPDGAGSTG